MSKDAIAKTYQKKTPEEHVLDNPDTYIGSIEKITADLFVVSDSSVGSKIVEKSVEIVPGLYKLFDEAIVNSRDHVIRMKLKRNSSLVIAEKEKVFPVTKIDVTINDDGTFSVFNDGNGIDILKHPEYKIWIPELIFAHLRTSTNYDKEEKKIVGGKNGFGIKLVFIWSSWGKIETVDHKTKLKYVQEFSDNLKTIGEPTITKCLSKPYTRVTFKPDYARLKIGIGCPLTDDFRAVLERRIYDIAAVTDKSVKVTYNGEALEVKNFASYVDLYVGSKTEVERIYEEANERWEYVACLAPSEEFTQVSFVNGIATTKGGKHVDYIVNQIVKKMTAYIKAKKGVDVKPASIKEQLMIFVNCTIENPAFDSQTKDYLNTAISNFGSVCEVSDKFVEKLAKMGIMALACSLTEVKDTKAAKKTDGSKCKTIRNIPKLVDANNAGTAKSSECTIILCEGDSAKSGIISGLSREDRNFIGIYPMKGKMFNIRGETVTKISDNKEIAEIKQILGLEHGKAYNAADIKTKLRYGKILFMTDQDLDGSHIKGLGINMLDSEWASLIEIPGFIGYMNTPILKATKGTGTGTSGLEFYNNGEFEKWKTTNDVSKWSIKYYKGLGTSTSKEFKTYFEKKKIVRFVKGEKCGDAIDMVFNKKRANDRKDWLATYDREKYLDTSRDTVTYDEFINHDLIHFSKYDNERSIPSMVDGLKISLRKILYSGFKKNLVSEIKVAQFSGYVSEHSGYHHGEASLNGAIVGLAQNFVGSNNINLFRPNGSFGTRLAMGKDSASERYIYTQLEKITRHLFPAIDDNVLTYLDDDGFQVEPIYYVPIIPFILVNGAKGIGTGFSTDIMCYNPEQIINHIEAILMHSKETSDAALISQFPIEPFYRGFKGKIYPTDETRKKYIVKGVYSIVTSDTIKITELPIGMATQSYKELLESLISSVKEKKDEDHFVKDYVDMSTDTEVEFSVTFHPGVLQTLLSEKHEYDLVGVEKYLKLYVSMSTNNMHLFNAKEQLKKYETVYDIVREYHSIRLEYYGKRKDYLVAKLGKELNVLSNKARYIKDTLDDKIDLRKKTKDAIHAMLLAMKFDLLEDSFNYLIKMPMDSVSQENVDRLLKEYELKRAELNITKEATLEAIWLKELDGLKKAYTEFCEDGAISATSASATSASATSATSANATAIEKKKGKAKAK